MEPHALDPAHGARPHSSLRASEGALDGRMATGYGVEAMKSHDNGAGHEAEPKCGSKTRAGGTCKNAAGFKTGHPGIGRCAFHGGATPTHERAATTELARRECVRLGVLIDTDLGEALLQAVYECAGNVAVYRELVQRLPPHPEPDEYVAGEDGDGRWRRGEPGVYGRTTMSRASRRVRRSRTCWWRSTTPSATAWSMSRQRHSRPASRRACCG